MSRNLKSESNFRRFEPLLADIASRFPAEVVLQVPGLRPSTIESRIREAAKGFIQNKYTSVLDYDSFRSLWPQVAITISDSGLAIARSRHGDSVAASGPAIAPGQTWTDDEIRAVALLLSTKKLSGPIEILDRNEHEVEVLIGLEFDVATFSENGKTYMI